MIGKLLDGRYQVIKILGVGGFGETYIAQDTRRPGNPICVVKHLKPASSDPRVFETAKRLFQSEAETLEHLGKHPQIPQLLAYFDENQEFFLVQEFVEGHPLTAELVPGLRWSESQVIQLLREVLTILEFVHSQGVIHRDIKPDNILRRTPDNKLVLVDFGAVKQLRTQVAGVDGQVSNATVAIGTPGYMPTEQGQGKPRPNSDIYSLGIIAIQGLTGVLPMQFQEDPNTGEILWQHLVSVSPGLAAVLTKMVRYHFKDRYQTATEALQALQQITAPYTPAPPAAAYNSTPGQYPANGGYQQTQPSYPPSSQYTTPVAGRRQTDPTPTNYSPPPTYQPRPVAAPSQPARTGSRDFLPLAVGIFLAAVVGGAAAALFGGNSRLLPIGGIGNSDGNDTASGKNCLAVLVPNSNIRSEPTSANSDNIIQTVPRETKLAVTGKRTPGGWTEVKLNFVRSAWTHSSVIANNGEINSCLQAKGIAIKTVDERSLITTRPNPKPTPTPQQTSNPSPAKPDQPTSDENALQILAEAKQKYDSGELLEAIGLLRKVSPNSSKFQEVTKTIQQWQQDTAIAQAKFKEVEQAVNEGRWNDVLAYRDDPELGRISQHWRDRLQPLFNQAENKAKEEATPNPTDSPTPTDTPTPIDSPSPTASPSPTETPN